MTSLSADKPLSWLSQPAQFQACAVDSPCLPAPLHPWVLLTNSMTAQLAQRFGGEPTVAVHFSGPADLLDWEQAALRCSDSQGYARHISLSIDQREVLAARSVTNLGSSIEPLLSQLQQTPLARVLFEDPLWQRDEAVISLSQSGLFGRACAWQQAPQSSRLLVEEFFLFDAVAD